MESKFSNQQEVDFDAMLSDIDAMIGETSEPSTVEASGGTVDFDTMLSDIDAMLAEPTTATSLEPRAEDRTWVGDMIDDKSSVYNQFNDAISNDFTKQITMGANAGFEGMLRTADTLFSDGVDGEYINRLKQNSRDVEDSLSEEQKTANRKEFFTDNPDGSWSVNSDAFLDFDKVTGVMAQGVGSLIPTMIGGGAIRGAGAAHRGGKSINKGINFLAGKVGATKTLTSRPKLREFLKNAGSKGLGFGASSTSMVVGGVSGDIQDHVRSMPIEILSKAPIYLEKRDELLDQGIPLAKAEIQAREEVALELGHWGMAKAAPLAMLLGTYAGRYIEDAFTAKVTGNLLNKSLIGLGVESGTEAGEGAQEQLVKNIQTQKVDPSVKTWQGVGESSVSEGIGGFGVAGGMSVAGGAVRKLGMKGVDLRQREELLSQQLNQDGSTRVQDHLDEQLRQPQEQEQQSEEQVIFSEEDMAELKRLEAIVLEEERSELALSRHRESKRRQQEILNRSVSNLGGEVVSSEIDSAYQQVDTQKQEQVEGAYAQQENQGTEQLAETLSDRAVNRFNSGIQQAEEHAIAEDEKSERLLSAIAKRDAILSKHPDFHGETLVFLDEIQESVQGEAVVKKIAEREITALNNAVDSLEALPKMTEQQGRLYEDAVELLDMGGMGVDIANTLTQRIQRTLPTTETVVEETEQVSEGGTETIPYERLTWDENTQSASRTSDESEVVDYNGRQMVIVNIGGVRVPFYKSTGHGGKKDVEAGKWYPFFGIGSDGWINKTSGKDINNYYGSEKLKQVAERLNKTHADLKDVPQTGATGPFFDAINEGLNPADHADGVNAVTKNISTLLERLGESDTSTREGTEEVYEESHIGTETQKITSVGDPNVLAGAIDGIDVEITKDELTEVWSYTNPETGEVTALTEPKGNINSAKEKLKTIVGDPTVDVEALRKADLKLSTGEGQVTGETIETISSLLSSTYNKAKALLKNKEVVVVQSVADLPQAMQERGRANANLDVSRRVEGLYDPKTKTTFIVADQVSKETINKVFLHEMLHKALAENPKLKEKLEGNIGGLKKVFEQVESGEFSGANKKIYEAAMSRVDKANTPPEQRFEEFLAYIVTEYNNNPDSLPAHIAKLAKDLIAQVRQALMGMGVELKNLSPADINAMAITAVRTQGVETQGDGVLASEEYRMEHTSSARGEGRSADDLSNVYPDDLYTHGVHYYGTGDIGDQNAIDILADLKGNPNGIVTIYRAVPPDVDEINHGDWVTITESYAQEHGERNMEQEGFHVISEEVRAKDIFTDGDSLHEWGYHPATFAPMESVKGETGSSTSEERVLIHAPYSQMVVDGDKSIETAAVEGFQDDFLFSIAQTNDPDANSAMEKIGPTNAPKSPKDRLEKTAKNIRGFFTRQNLADQYDSFRRIGDKKTSWMLARMSNLGSNIVEGAIKIGSPVFHEDNSGGLTYKAGSRSLTDILAPLQGEIDYFLAFRAGHRAEDFLRSAEVGNVQVNDLTYTMKLAKKRRTAIRNAIKNRVNLTQAERKSLIAEEKEINAHLKVKKAELKVAREKAKSKEKLFTRAEVQALKNLPDTLEGDIGGRSRREVYEEVAQEFDAMHDDFVQLGVKTGLFSEQQAQKWKDGGVYIPFHRLNDDEEQTSMHSPSGLTKLTEQDGTHKLKGSEKNLDDLLTNVLMNWSHITDAALHNLAAVSVTRDLHQDGGIAMPEIFQGNKKQYEEAKKDKNRYVYWVRVGGDKVLVELTPNPDDDTQDSLDKAMFEVEMLHQSLTGMAHLGYADLLTSVGGAAKQLLSKGVTLNPTFKINNLWRDTFTAIIVAPMNLNIMKNVIQGWKIMRDADSETRKEMQFGGASFSHGFTRGSDVEATKALIARGVPQENIIDSPQKVFGKIKQKAVNAYEWYEGIGYVLENVNRAAQFEQSKDRGANALERNFEARDHLDFGSHGASKLLRGLTQTTAFLNARIQGLDKLARASQDKTTIEGRQVLDTQQKQFWAMASTYIGASLALWLLMKDDEEYQKLTTHERATYHVVRVGGSLFYVPRPFEVGAVAESVERLTEQVFKALEGEGFDGKFLVERLSHHLTNTFNFNLPTALVPVVEVGINKNFFTGGVVDNTSGLREDRTKSTTSNLAKGASWLFSPTGALGLPQMSPIQADHFIRGYTAWAGTAVTGVVDAIVNPMLEGAEPEPFDVYDTPVLKSFFKELDGKSSNFFVEEFYKRREPAREIEGSLRLVPEGDTERTEELHKLAEEKGVELFSDVSRSMGEIRKALKENKADRTISGEERERIRKELINDRNELAREVYEEVKDIGEEDEGEEESESSDSSLLNLIGIGDAHADEKKFIGEKDLNKDLYIDLSATPLTQKELHGKKGEGHVFYGADAVAKVKAAEGNIPPEAERIIELEGFVDVPYLDHKGIETVGVGQTGDFMRKSFMDTFRKKEEAVAKILTNYETFPPYLKAELVQAMYRGDIKEGHSWVKQVNQGKFKEASDTFLIHKEYEGLLKTDPDNGVVARLEAVSKAMRQYGTGRRGDEKIYIVQKGDSLFKVAKKYNLSVPELKKMNNIKDVSKIRVGKKLKV